MLNLPLPSFTQSPQPPTTMHLSPLPLHPLRVLALSNLKLQGTIRMSLVRSKSKIKEMLRRWQTFTHPERAYAPMDSALRKTKSSTWNKELYEPEVDYDNCGQSEASSSTATLSSTSELSEGHLAVYVGRERRRFVISANLLNQTLVRGLIEKSDEGCPDDNEGGLTIACEVVLFEHLLWLINNDDPSSRQMEVDELLEYYKY